jgi:hypothetical protein
MSKYVTCGGTAPGKSEAWQDRIQETA